MPTPTPDPRPNAAAMMPWMLGCGGLVSLLCAPVAWANPQGLVVVAGSATAVPAGPTLTLTVSDRAVLNWQSFNLAPGETTRFQQPNAASVVWNQVLDANPSHLFGNIQANGIVVLANRAGFWFGPDSVVKAASFVATTAGGPPADLASGGSWNLSYAPPLASIINYGHIEAAKGGSVFLVAEKVVNQGVLMAPDGNIGLYAGKEVLVSDRPDGRGLSAKISLPGGSVDNFGKLVADAGTIAIHAQVVNQSGIVQAGSVREQNGVIELIAGDLVTLGAGSLTSARGDSSTASPGGSVIIQSGRAYRDDPTAKVSVAGGRGGGDGGFIEVSADDLPGVRAEVDGSAAAGSVAGRLLIDPDTIVIDAVGTGSGGSGVIQPGDVPNQLRVNPSAFENFSQITLQARSTIDVNTLWNLADTTASGAKLTLDAGKDLRFGPSGGIIAGQGWSVDLTAGKDFTSGQVVSGTGSVLLNGGSSVTAADGSVKIAAGKDVTVQRGFIHTTGGGEISIAAVGGSINTGTRVDGFVFRSTGAGYEVAPGLGGISTAAGGDVSLTAGKDVVSFLPTQVGAHSDGGSGAFGAGPGDVTVTAGGSVYGHFVVRNGTGTITAADAAGEANRQLALSLVKGSWDVAATDIALQEVRNPNGIFNRAGRPSDATFHRFDYDAAASVTLTATDGVQLLGGALPRNPNEAGVPVLYPPTLDITAGAGGVLLGNNLTLFPSPLGQLSVTTTAGGDLRSRDAGKTYELVMSDSAATQFTFANGQFGRDDHAPVPVHQDDTRPARLDIAGDLRDLLVAVPKRAEIRVGGDVVNASFVGQNLRASDETRIEVAGAVRNRSDYTFVPFPEGFPVPDFALLDIAEPKVSGTFIFDAKNRQLGFRGRLTDDTRDALLAFHVLVFDPPLDPLGVRVVDLDGIQLTTPYPLLPAAVINALYDASKDVPQRQPEGYQIAGPGKLTVRAHDLDLGATAGIISSGAQSNPALAKAGSKGADIDIQLAGDLSMTSSAIVSKSGGDIRVVSGGRIEVGSEIILPTSDLARGIYTSAGSSVSVVAKKDILLNGSRIAAYDGGSITVRSLEGSVDAGSGGLSLQSVEQVRVTPDGQVEVLSDYIPGSGILATTFSYGSTQVGDITIDTPRGDILARAGGVVQAAFNRTSTAASSVKLTAGTRKTDSDPGFEGKIDASRSGVIGGNVSLDATGPVIGVIFASGNINIDTPQSVNVTALAQGTANVTAGGSISGTVAGIGAVNASGGTIDAALLSQNVTAAGGTSGQVGFSTANAAGATSTAAAAATSDAKPAAIAEAKDEDDKRRAAPKPVLARTIGRVTVILPGTSKAN